ncbi:hypothetical protein [Nonomuraea sp. LPB2021202275-12-8]|uniref:hypothetical protein n=1 Tax=Nonomuraea sp. LPB2021202275-12-8 TaxID=3120159 RepID=UPI00300C19AA
MKLVIAVIAILAVPLASALAYLIVKLAQAPTRALHRARRDLAAAKHQLAIANAHLADIYARALEGEGLGDPTAALIAQAHRTYLDNSTPPKEIS